MLFTSLIFGILIVFVFAEKCPPIFGEFECPKDFKCVFGVCKNDKDEIPLNDCTKITCELDSHCINGKCLPIEGLPCGRNVLVAENTARAIVSDCGWRGKCINGRCTIDKCFEKLCNEDETCRDGTCTRLLGAFCWSNFDCGPLYRCQSNRCITQQESALAAAAAISQSSSPRPRCDPGEIFKDHKCQKQEGCEKLVCDIGESCLDGVCVPLAIDCRTEACPKGMICAAASEACPKGMICAAASGLCALDPCVQRGCPSDHACLLGECRPLQGMICHEHCPVPFECVNGICVRNECRRKVCQIGERCDGGLCIRVEGAFCSLAIRDCGEEFECQENGGAPKICRDKIKAINNGTTEITEFS
uniref:Uncharacterized protein n=1 Tax=Panagrolaimus sp. PS1159 TaxID=55785 RepID=A0AC35FTF7_9BILA